MRALVTPFLLGTAAAGLLVSGAALALAAGAGGNVHVALGPVSFVIVERSANVTSTSFGPGLMLAALAGGMLNALAAALLRRRS